MYLSAEHSLSSTSIEILESLVEARPATTEVSQEDLLGFLLRTLGEEDKKRVARTLLAHPEYDRRLIELDAEIRQRINRPLSEWPNDAFLQFVKGNVARLFTAFETIFRHQTSGSIDRTPEIRRLLADAAERTRQLYANPAFAANRGQVATNRLYAEIGEAGTLTVTAWPSGEEAAQNRIALLSYVDPAGGVVPLEYAELREGAWNFEVSEFARTTDFPSGPLPEEFFTLSFETSDPNHLSSSVFWVDLPDGTLSGWEINRSVVIKDGWLRMSVVVPSSVHERYPKHQLELWVPLGDYEALLGIWPMGSLQRTFEIIIPVGSNDTDAPVGTLIRLRIGAQADSLHED
jgi:hypothetical protein